MDAQTDISNWVASIPKITRWWFFSFFILPLTTRLGLLNPMTLVMFPDLALGQFQVRPQRPEPGGGGMFVWSCFIQIFL